MINHLSFKNKFSSIIPMKILCIFFVVANGKKQCSITSCLVCETNAIRTSELCEVAKPCCEKVNKYLSENINNAISENSAVSTGKIENSMPSISSSTINIGIPEFHRIFPEKQKLRGTHGFGIFLFICIFLCFIVTCQRYLKFLKSHWSIY